MLLRIYVRGLIRRSIKLLLGFDYVDWFFSNSVEFKLVLMSKPPLGFEIIWTESKLKEFSNRRKTGWIEEIFIKATCWNTAR